MFCKVKNIVGFGGWQAQQETNTSPAFRHFQWSLERHLSAGDGGFKHRVTKQQHATTAKSHRQFWCHGRHCTDSTFIRPSAEKNQETMLWTVLTMVPVVQKAVQAGCLLGGVCCVCCLFFCCFCQPHPDHQRVRRCSQLACCQVKDNKSHENWLAKRFACRSPAMRSTWPEPHLLGNGRLRRAGRISARSHECEE